MNWQQQQRITGVDMYACTVALCIIDQLDRSINIDTDIDTDIDRQ